MNAKVKACAAVFAVAAGLGTAFAAGPVKPLTSVYNRNYRLLNGRWNYIVDQQLVGFRDYRRKELADGFFKDARQDGTTLVEYDFDKAPSMDVPGAWNSQVRELFHYEGAVWLRRVFDAKPDPDCRTILQFGAVNYEAHVYLNGQPLGSHVGGFTPFAFDVTDVLKNGRNSLVVLVDDSRRTDGVPADAFDWFNWGGITRDVMLVTVPGLYISDAYIQTAKGDAEMLVGEVELSEAKAGERVAIAIPELSVFDDAETDERGVARFSIRAEPELWSPDSPRLYRVTFRHGDEKLEDDIGFRVVESVGRSILLNGDRIFLKGVCIHDEASGAKGRVKTQAEADELVARAKRLGCNFVRLAHYLHNEFTVRAAERAGLLVWSETPTYWMIDWGNPATYENAKAQMLDAIRRDRSRANVIIWSVANETPRCPERDEFLRKLIAEVRRADDTRLVSLAMELSRVSGNTVSVHDNLADAVDIVAFNEYIGWYRPMQEAAGTTWDIPYHKPVVVSEFGAGAKYGFYGDANTRFSEFMQAEVYRGNIPMIMGIKGISGMSPWVLSDFRSPRRNLDGVQDGFNRKGLTDEFGREKKAFGVLRDFYSK